jgi:hypothetical protein
MGGFIVPPMPPMLVEALKRSVSAPAPLPTGQPLPGASTNLGPTGMNLMPQGTAPLNSRAPVTLPQSQNPGPLPMSNPMPAPRPPIHIGSGGVNLDRDASTPPGVGASGIPFSPMPSSAKLPQVTDDPSVPKSGAQPGPMGAMPHTPDLGSYLNPALHQYQSDLAGYQKADEANRIDPQQVKPRLWERLVGFGLGATQLKNPENAGAVAGEVVNRRRTGAELARNTALAPWTQRLQQDKEGVPLAESAARIAGEQGRLDLDTAKENRERYSAITNAQYKEDIASIREEIANGNREKAENLLDQKQKELEQKKDHDAEWFQMQHAILDLREKAADKGKDHTAQTMGAETQKANALREADRAFDRAYAAEYFPGPNEPWTDSQRARLAQLEQQRDDAKQAGEDAYEAKSSELKGAPVEHQDVSSWRSKPAANAAAAPAAAPSAATPSEDKSIPTAMGPKNETPAKVASDGKTKIGFYKSTGQWMLVPTQGASK